MEPAAILLELQRIDLEVDSLNARLSEVHSGRELASARIEADTAEADLGEHRLRLSAMDRDGARLEHEIDSLRQRSLAEERRLYDGSIANAKELGSLQHEIENLSRRISDREDELLAMLEQHQQVEALAADAEKRTADLRVRSAEAESRSVEETGRLGSELAERLAAREALLPAVEGEMLELYEDLRRQKKGLGAVAIVDGICQGCHEQLSAMEFDRLKHSAGVKRCEHCRRIVVLDA
jgi:predicted  nucleic acid-binding Zn-ribbon protein